jgi:endonuclease/exonuclease/phosphatase family metal-dependent hydrolase
MASNPKNRHLSNSYLDTKYIACITETHLKNTDPFKLNGFNIYRTDRNSTHSSGGVAILIKKNIKHYQSTLSNITNIEATAIIISTERHDIKIISAYNPPNKKILQEDISLLFQGMPTILLGDLNSKHQTWGCQKTNPNGNKLHKFTSEQRIIISPPAEPTFQRSGRLTDILDIALISNLPIDLHHVVLNELDSDHVPVISTLNEQIKAKNPIPKLINAPINWEAFRKNLDEKLNNHKRYSDPDDINKSIVHLTDTIKIAVTQAQIKKHTTTLQPTNSLPNAVQNLIK